MRYFAQITLGEVRNSIVTLCEFEDIEAMRSYDMHNACPYAYYVELTSEEFEYLFSMATEENPEENFLRLYDDIVHSRSWWRVVCKDGVGQEVEFRERGF